MRILVTGLGTFWGSRIAQRLEQTPGVELVVGVDTREPRLPLRRTEFVKADASYGILQRMVRATRVDTVLHTHLEVDSTRVSSRRLHEVNVIGTMNLLAAAAADGSSVRKVVLKTSTLVYGSNFDDPYFFREGDAPHASAVDAGRALAPRDRRPRPRLRRGQPRRGGDVAALRQRARRRHHHRVLAHAPHAGRAGGVRLRSAPAVRPRGRRHPGARARDRHRHAGHVQRGRAGDHHVERSVSRGRRAAAWRCPR